MSVSKVSIGGVPSSLSQSFFSSCWLGLCAGVPDPELTGIFLGSNRCNLYRGLHSCGDSVHVTCVDVVVVTQVSRGGSGSGEIRGGVYHEIVTNSYYWSRS